MWSEAPPARRAGGIPTSPYATLPPYIPFKRPKDTPGPPLWRKGYFPLFLDRQGPYRACPLFGLRPAANRVPHRVRPLPGT